jgi:hypothetical protein
LRFEIELDQEVVIDISCDEGALMDTNCCRDVVFFCVLGLINEGVTVFGGHRELVEV